MIVYRIDANFYFDTDCGKEPQGFSGWPRGDCQQNRINAVSQISSQSNC